MAAILGKSRRATVDIVLASVGEETRRKQRNENGSNARRKQTIRGRITGRFSPPDEMSHQLRLLNFA
jgi:hypothetical protein